MTSPSLSFDDWLDDLVRRVDELAGLPGSERRRLFADYALEWTAGRAAFLQNLAQWRTRRQAHEDRIARRVPPGEPIGAEWQWEYASSVVRSLCPLGKASFSVIGGWFPPDAQLATKPTEQMVLPLPLRLLRLPEKYALLAAIHDSYEQYNEFTGDGIERIVVFETPEPNSSGQEQIDRSITFAALVSDVGLLADKDRPRIEQLLSDVRADLDEKLPPSSPSSKAQEKPASSKRKRGRPSDTDPHFDRRVHDAWRSGRYASRAELAAELGITPAATVRSLDRHRSRQKSQKKGRGLGLIPPE